MDKHSIQYLQPGAAGRGCGLYSSGIRTPCPVFCSDFHNFGDIVLKFCICSQLPSRQ